MEVVVLHIWPPAGAWHRSIGTKRLMLLFFNMSTLSVLYYRNERDKNYESCRRLGDISIKWICGAKSAPTLLSKIITSVGAQKPCSYVAFPDQFRQGQYQKNALAQPLEEELSDSVTTSGQRPNSRKIKSVTECDKASVALEIGKTDAKSNMSHNQIVTESDIRCNIISLVEKKETALRHARYHAPLHLAPLSGHYDQRAKASPHSSVLPSLAMRSYYKQMPVPKKFKQGDHDGTQR